MEKPVNTCGCAANCVSVSRPRPPRRPALDELRETHLHLITSIDDAKKLEGQEVGLSDWIVLDQNRIDLFAEATDDFQWAGAMLRTSETRMEVENERKPACVAEPLGMYFFRDEASAESEAAAAE